MGKSSKSITALSGAAKSKLKQKVMQKVSVKPIQKEKNKHVTGAE